MMNLDNVLKSIDLSLMTKVQMSNLYFFLNGTDRLIGMASAMG